MNLATRGVDGNRREILPEPVQDILTEKNDHGQTFERIADYIEQNL